MYNVPRLCIPWKDLINNLECLPVGCYKGNVSIYINLYLAADSICVFPVVDADVLIAPFNGL